MSSSSSTERPKIVAASDALLTAGIIDKNNQPANDSQLYPNCTKFAAKTFPIDLPKKAEKPNGSV
jgi:hypothetical protein